MYDEESTTYEDPHVIASSSTGESSNRTLQCDFIETKDHFDVLQAAPRSRDEDIGTRLSDRYTYSFSADLIDQFDKYRARMRESIRQELEADEKSESDKELKESEIIVMSVDDDEGEFSVHQVHHSNFGSNIYSQDSAREGKPRHLTVSDMDSRSMSVTDNEARIDSESIEFQ
ncbi:9777_t:CDS:2, partial [Acaulospora morrowiae]